MKIIVINLLKQLMGETLAIATQLEKVEIFKRQNHWKR